MADITLWKPEADLLTHQALGKVAEELGELSAIVARCLIQGIDASDPKTGKPNRQALVEEISDLTAALFWMRTIAQVPQDSSRVERKLGGFIEWGNMLQADRGERADRLAKLIVQSVCEIDEAADPQAPDTISVAASDLEAVIANRIEAHG